MTPAPGEAQPKIPTFPVKNLSPSQLFQVLFQSFLLQDKEERGENTRNRETDDLAPFYIPGQKECSGVQEGARKRWRRKGRHGENPPTLDTHKAKTIQYLGIIHWGIPSASPTAAGRRACSHKEGRIDGSQLLPIPKISQLLLSTNPSPVPFKSFLGIPFLRPFFPPFPPCWSRDEAGTVPTRGSVFPHDALVLRALLRVCEGPEVTETWIHGKQPPRGLYSHFSMPLTPR